MQLGSGDRHFDPSRSETLRAIQQEGYYRGPGYNQQYVVHQHPHEYQQEFYNNPPEQYHQYQQNQPQRQVWHEEYERARSQTPNQYKYYYSDDVKIPYGQPPQYTTDTPAGVVQIRYNSLPRPKKENTHHK
jgi:hypothetical protein